MPRWMLKYTKCLLYPISFHAIQIVNPSLNSRTSANPHTYCFFMKLFNYKKITYDKIFSKNISLCFYYHYATILYYSLYKNDYSNIEISWSYFSGIPRRYMYFYFNDKIKYCVEISRKVPHCWILDIISLIFTF